MMENAMNWTQVLAIVGSNIALIMIMFGTTIAMWLHSDKKIEAIQKEMKDFHGRLEKQDAEFRGRMEKQDAEFKAHLMYHHCNHEKHDKKEEKEKGKK